MKNIFLVTLLFLSAASSSFSQSDTLLLKITELKKAKIVLQLNGQTPLGGEGAIAPASNPWFLKVVTTNGAKITVTNTEGDGASKELLSQSKTYTINNGIIADNGLKLEKNFKIEVSNKASGELVKGYQLTKMAAVVSTTNISTTPTTIVSAATDYKPGSIILDALYLANGPSLGLKAKILSYYGLETKGLQLKAAFAQNDFLKAFADTIIDKAGAQSSVGLGSVFSSIGGLDVTSLADGAAKFIVKRAKQELSLAFFQKLKKVIDETPDISTVFPQTANLLQAMGEEVYDYEKYIQNLRESFKKDLADVHRNLPGITDNHPEFFSHHQPVKAALLSACYMAQELENGSHPGDIIATYPVHYLDSISNKNFKGAIQTVQLLSASLRNSSATEEDTYWVNIKKVRELVNDRLALKIYLGLLLQEAKTKHESIPFETTNLVTLLTGVAAVYDNGFTIYQRYRNYVLQFGEKVEALNKMIKEEDDKNLSDSAKIERYAKYFRTSINLLEYCTQTSTLPVINTVLPNLQALLGKYFSIAYAAADIAVDVNRKNYSSVINDAVRIYNLVTVRSVEDESLSVMPAGGTSLTAASNTAFKDDFERTITKLIRYGSFIATIATAKNSDEVEQAIEAAALPVGSSRIKRVSDFNVALNAYAGVFYGAEKIQGLDKGPLNANVYGVTAPIGVAASWGHRLFFIPTGKSEWSTSVFISLVDIGAVAAFRFTDDSTSQIPSIQLKNIFSPGAFLSIGIPKTPLSLGFGAQVGPNLRKVSAKNNDFSDALYWRFSTSLAVDIPLFNFHTKTK